MLYVIHDFRYRYIGNLNLRARISGYVCLQTKTKKT